MRCQQLFKSLFISLCFTSAFAGDYVDVDANIRSYYFIKDFSLKERPDQRAFSLGGKINILTAPFWTGFNLGATLYTAQPLGLNPSYDSGLADKSLPAVAVTTLGQAFVQYQVPCFLVRVGNQLINTPWANEADTRMIPAAYQAVFASLNPFREYQELSIEFLRFQRFKSRPVSSFSRTNLYNNSLSIGSPIDRLLGTEDNGALAVGALYKDDIINAEAWAYRFYDYATLNYANINYQAPEKLFGFLQPILSAQIINQGPTGENVIAKVGAGNVGTNAYGLQMGTKIRNGRLLVGYNKIDKERGGFKHGDIVSPYTTNYTADPLYTTSMIAGLIEKAAGHAYHISGVYHAFNEQLRLYASYAHYFTMPFTPDTNETDFDITYLPKQFCKQLSLRYRFGIMNNDPAYDQYIYQRFMFEYDFL